MAFQTKKPRRLYTLPNLGNFERGQKYSLNQGYDDCEYIDLGHTEYKEGELENTKGEIQKPLSKSLVDFLDQFPLAPLYHKEGRILEAVYEYYRANGELTKEEIKKIEEIDAILKTADIVVNKQSGDAIIVTDDKFQKTSIDFDEKRVKWNNDSEPYFNEENSNLNNDGKFLEEAYKAFREPYNKFFEKPNNIEITKQELEKLEQIDEILEAADIIVNKQTGDATIITDEGEIKEIELDPCKPSPSGGRGCR